MQWHSPQQRQAVMRKLHQPGQSGPGRLRRAYAWMQRTPLHHYPLLAAPLLALSGNNMGAALSRWGATRSRAAALRAGPLDATPGAAAKVWQAAKKLYPQVGRLWVGGGKAGGIAKLSGDVVEGKPAGFYHPGVARAAQWIKRERGALPSVPFVFADPTQASREFLAHELGHSAYHLGRAGRLKNIATGLSQGILHHPHAPGVIAGLSAGAQPLISRAPVSEQNKRRLRIAAGLVPLATSTPLLFDEAQASYKAGRIMSKLGVSRWSTLKQLGPPYLSYVGAALPGALFGGGIAGLYLARHKLDRLWHRRQVQLGRTHRGKE